MVRSDLRTKFRDSYHQAILLLSLLLLLLLSPILSELNLRASKSFLSIFFSIILFACIFAVSRGRGVLVAASLLAVPALLFRWMNEFINIPEVFHYVFDILFLLYISATILSYVLRTEKVTTGQIFGAINVYFLIGLIWQEFYLIIYEFFPRSFGMTDPDPAEFLYYSYVTLSTLGYGDITPLTPIARSFAAIEAMIGQLYIAVLIAALVGQRIADANRQSKN